MKRVKVTCGWCSAFQFGISGDRVQKTLRGPCDNCGGAGKWEVETVA
jgi:hypothetical protein